MNVRYIKCARNIGADYLSRVCSWESNLEERDVLEIGAINATLFIQDDMIIKLFYFVSVILPYTVLWVKILLIRNRTVHRI